MPGPHGTPLAATGAQDGWAGLLAFGYSDTHCLLAIAVLAMLSMVSLAGILPQAVRLKDRWFAIAAVAELIILLLAATGVLN